MLSLQQAYEVRASIIEYLKATFYFKEKEVKEAFLRFIENEENGLFKGPYLSLKLPFEKSDAAGDIPLAIKPPFPPFNHQLYISAHLPPQFRFHLTPPFRSICPPGKMWIHTARISHLRSKTDRWQNANVWIRSNLYFAVICPAAPSKPPPGS